MKILNYVIPVILFSAGLSAFDDRPALTVKERVALASGKAAGAIIGLAAGVPLFIQGQRNWRYDRQYYAGAAACAAGGSIATYNIAGNLVNRLFAWRHGVSYAVEKVVRFYDINIEQYWVLFDAAAKKDADGLHRAIQDVYERRFGVDWQSRLREFLVDYKDFATYLSGAKKASLSKKECDLIRMIEIGAALENIYFGRAPSRKTSVEAACKIYPFLGFDIGSFSQQV